MKRKVLLMILSMGIPLFHATAQECPPEWMKYTYGGYVYDIESDFDNNNLGETRFTNHLLNIARTNLAKQIKVSVRDNATINKIVVNGRTTKTYASVTNFSTDLNIKLLETKVKYSPETRRGYAIACIPKNAALRYYKNELNTFFNRISNALTNAGNYMATGFNRRAKTELESVLSEFDTVDEYFFWLAVFDLPQAEIEKLLERRYELEQAVKQYLAELQHATSICLVCTLDLFGSPDKPLENKLCNGLKGILSKRGCNFTDSSLQADWVIRIAVSAREYSKVRIENQTQYYAYADADISIDKSISSQRICEERVSEKGGHTFNYKEAARAALTSLKEPLSSLIIENIEE